MANIYDVAKYILNKCGSMTTVKLQKLCYYCQAWSLVWDSTPLFDDDFQAWANGPVNKKLFEKCKDSFEVSKAVFDKKDLESELTQKQKNTIDTVLKSYGSKDGYFLMQLSHMERPWIETRGTVKPGYPCTKIIKKDLMQEYYGGLCEKTA